MKTIIAKSIHRTAALPNVSISPNDQEQKILRIILAACNDISKKMGYPIEARVAGGWVRDKLLGRESDDIDVSMNMNGDEFATFLFQFAQFNYGDNQNIVSEPVFAPTQQNEDLHVAFVYIHGQKIDILPLRGNEVYEEGSRNPTSTDVAEPEEDAHRRDLTINSLFYNINTGQAEDFTGQGYEDLQTMTLRTPTRPGHDPGQEALRILTEDPLRLLRILRFNSRYQGSTIDPTTLQAMNDDNIRHQVVRRLQGDEIGGMFPERIAIELRKIMTGSQPEAALRVMYDTGLLKDLLLLPEDYNPLDMDQKNKHHQQTVIQHTFSVLGNANNLAQEFGLSDEERITMNLASLFHDLGKLDARSHKTKDDGSRGYSGDPDNPDAVSHQQASQERWLHFAKALKLSDNETQTVSELVYSHMNPHAHVEDRGEVSDKQLRRYLRKNPEWAFQYIHAMADSMSKGSEPNPSAADPYRENYERLNQLSQPEIVPQDLLNGGAIIQLVGLPAKPPPGLTGYIEVIKEELRQLQDDQPQLSPEEATNLVSQWVQNGQLNIGILAPYFQPAV